MSTNKIIAKNSIALYLRMFFVMMVGLYTSRIVLKTLGVEDYGVYNVVGGFVAMLAFLNKIFVDATQRFLSFTLGENNIEKLRLVFSTSLTVHILIAIVVLLFAETVGLWFVNNKLVIDVERLSAANWVYQCSILSLIVTIVSVPYRAIVVAHEKMYIYAYFGIVEVILKLVIVYLLLISDFDKLMLYGILHLLISLIVPVWNWVYCRNRFAECAFKLHINGQMFKKMISFSIWTMIGSLGFSFKDQFSNIIMNIFLGSTINAARGVTTQVNGIVMNFAENFTTAMSPQITKQYASGDVKRSQYLVKTGARFSFLLMSLIVIPVIVHIDSILNFWLDKVPDYTSSFVCITLISSLYYSCSKPLTVALMATGEIKWFQIGVSIIMLVELPIAFLLLKHGYPPHYALMPAVITNIFGVLFRYNLLRKKNFILNGFVSEVLVKCSLIMIVSYIICNAIRTLLMEGLWHFLMSITFSFIITILIIYLVGTTQEERRFIRNFINGLILRKKDENNNYF